VAVDLHTHSNASDGSESPATVIRRAADAGLSAVALTDHDNLEGIGEAKETADALGVTFIAGTELSVEWSTGPMHLLVYFLEPGSGPLQDVMVDIRRGRTDRNHQLAQRLRSLGVDVTYDEVAKEAGGTGVGRPHFAAVMVAKGFVPDIPSAFDRYLAAGRPGYVPRVRLAAEEAIRLARESAAIPVIAHPHTLGVGVDDYNTAFQSLTKIGLGGLECYYSEYTPELRDHLADVASGLGIIATGGSDYHGSYKRGLDVGIGRGDLAVPDAAAEALFEAHAAM
jgi:predicted metal-dependent phosphoesterase TrpH